MKDKLDLILDNVKEEMLVETISNEEKERILDMTLCKLTKTKKKINWQHYLKVAAVILFICMAGSTATYAAYNLSPSFQYLFYSYKHDVRLDGNTTEVNQSCTGNGVKVIVPEVVGDKYGVYILLKVKGISNALDYYYPGFEKAEVVVEGGKSYDFGRPSGGAYIGGVQQLIYHVNTQEKLVGKRVTLKLQNYGSYISNMDNTFTTTVKGNWKISWVLDYKDLSRTIPVNKTLPAFGGQVTIKEVNISPISTTFVLKDAINLSKYNHSSKNEARIKVKFVDDSIVDSAFTDLGLSSSNQRLISINYQKTVDLSEIEYVSFAGLTIPVSQNKNPIARQDFNVPELGFDINMSKKLYDVITRTEKTVKNDSDLKCKLTTYTFTGKVKNTEMDMFSIQIYNRIISKTEFGDSPVFYIGTKNGCTYLLYIAEDGNDEQIKLFGDLINDDVAKLLPWIQLEDIK